jgi:DNA-binding CsgD family transcriptional regulator
MTEDPAIRRLTLQETRVARLVAEGHTDAEIAQRLSVSVMDVTADVADIFRKLGLRSRTELALLAPDSGLEERRNVDG